MEEPKIVNNIEKKGDNGGQKQIAGAIIIAGLVIAGAILIKGNTATVNSLADNALANITIAKVGPNDRTLGNAKAKVTLIMYEDFQCPFCGAVFGSQSNIPLIQSLKQSDPSWAPFEPPIINDYVKNGSVQFVYRDYPFLGPESIEAAQAARCAGDQGQFWQYHDYLFSHQNGENQGAFVDAKLEGFAKTLGLDQTAFNQCLSTGKYAQTVADSKTEGTTAGVTGTPKGFILKNGKVVATIDGAEPWSMVQPKIDSALK